MDSQAQVKRLVTAERNRLETFVRRINGREQRDAFWRSFDVIAADCVLGRYDAVDMREGVAALTVHAAETIAQQDRRAGRKGRRGVRRPWATWPTDGSARMGRAERVFVAVPMLVSAVVVLWVMMLPGMRGGSSAPAPDTAVSVGSAVGEERPGGRFATPRITLDVNDLPSSDCWYEVTLTDPDGMAGGVKVAHVEPLCP